MAKAIEVIGVTKVFTSKEEGKKKVVRAVDNVSLSLDDGEFVGLLGPNGAGKTTLIKILGTLILPTGGTAMVAGFDVVKEPDTARSSFGWLHGETGGRALYWRLSALENLRFYASLQNVPMEVARKRIDVLLDFFDLVGDKDKMVKDFSTGMKVRVMLARSLLANPPILLMDEPTVGLDPITADETRKLLISLNKDLGRTILFTSHNMLEVEKLCHRVAIMHKGKLIADGSPAMLSKLHREAEGIDLEVESTLALDDLKKVLESLPRVKKIVGAKETEGSYAFQLEVEGERESLYEMPAELRKAGITVTSISCSKPSLEDVFLRLTRP